MDLAILENNRIWEMETINTIVVIASAITAVIAALFAWRSAKAAEKTYGVELIGQLYTLYQSPEMNANLSTVWRIYKRIWIIESDSEDAGIQKANNGVPITLKSAISYFNDLDVESDEFKAIHYTINFWTYLELLLKRKVLTRGELSAFTSPYIL